MNWKGLPMIQQARWQCHDEFMCKFQYKMKFLKEGGDEERGKGKEVEK